MNWVNPASGDWDVASNWSTGAVPTSADDVTIDTASPITISISAGDNISINNITTAANDTLSFNGGSLTVAAASTLDGPLSMNGGTLTALGPAASLIAHGATTISGASLYADSGGTLSLPNLTSYATNGNVIDANGAGSLIGLPSLANLACSGSLGIYALGGGEINLSGLANLAGSGNTDNVRFTDTGNSKILDGNLKSLDAFDVTLDGTDQHVADSWTQCTNSFFGVSGGAYTLPALTDVDGTGLEVNSGGRLALPSVTNFAGAHRDSFIQGPGSVLDMSALKAESGTWPLLVEQGAEVKLSGLKSMTGLYISDTGGSKVVDNNVTSLSHVGFSLDGSDTQVAASWTSFTNSGLTITGGSYNLSALADFNGSNASVTNGGRLALSGLTGMTDSSSFSTFTASGAGSTLDLSALAAVAPTAYVNFNATYGGGILLTGLTDLSSDNSYRIQMTDTGGGAIVDGNLTRLTGVLVTSDGTDPHLADAWINFVNGEMSVIGGATVLPNVTNADGAELLAKGGGVLTLPALKSYDTGSPLYGGAFEADGSGSTLNLPALAGITEQNGRGWVVNVAGGGEINLPAMTSLAGTASRALNVTFAGSGTIADGNLAALSYVNVMLSGAGTQAGAAWTQLLHSTLGVNGDSETFSSLTELNGTNVNVYGGGRLALPALTTFACDGSWFIAEGAGSVLDMSGLTSVTGPGFWNIAATDGGEVKLTGLQSLSRANGANVSLDDFNGSTILAPNLSSLNGVQVWTDGTDAQLGDAWTSFTNGGIALGEIGSISHSLSQAGALNLPNVADAEGSTLSARDGGSLTLPALKQVTSYLWMFADGTGSTLDFPSLASITAQYQYSINATNGGQIKLPALSALSVNSGYLSIVDTNHSAVVLPATLTDLNGVSFTLDGTDSQVAQAWTNFTNGGITLIGGSYALPKLTDLDGSSLYVQNGASLSLPSLSSYAPNAASFVASGAGSLLDASGLANVSLSGGWSVRAAAGGDIKLHGLAGIASNHAVSLAADGAGSAVEIPNLAMFAGSDSSVTVGDGGSIALGAQTVAMPSAGPGLTIIVPYLPFNVPINLSSTGTFKDATFFISGGDTVNIADGTFTGNTLLGVNQQATLDLTGGNLVDYSGTLGIIPASEFGTVRLASGGVAVGPTGLTLDFPPRMFQWTGGEFYASSTGVTNASSLEIGPGQKLTDTGDWINRGALTIDAGSQLAVGGDFTQTPGGTLNIFIAGTPASGQFGQLAVKNAAALAGSVGVFLTGGFVPQDNEDFRAMTFAGESGNFSNIGVGLPFRERLQPTSLDFVTVLHDTIDSPVGATLNAAEGTTFSGGVASFANPNLLTPASDYTAMIDWGDGTKSSGGILADNAGGFSISGSHVYAEEGTKTLTVSVFSLDGATATIHGQAIVSEATISAGGAAFTVGQAVSLTGAVVATFTHGAGAEAPADFTAAIDWGDGKTSAGAVVEANGKYSVSGSHVYAQSGAFAVRTTVTDDGVSTVIDGSATVLSPDAMHAEYVAAVFKDVLGRAADAKGLAYWTKQLDGGAANSSVAEAIAHSDEYYANFVIKPDYSKLLGRAADDGAVTYWTARMHAGLTDQQLEAEVAASDEFYKAAENFDPAPDADDTTIADLHHNVDWVDAVYKLLLGRTVDSGGETYWTKQLASGVSRGDVAFLIANGAENNSQLINADYFHYLGRAADADGLKYWLQQFADGKTNEDVIVGFAGSNEYYKNHTS